MTYLQNALADRAKDSIIGYSYNGEFYNEAMQELQKRFRKPQHVKAEYLDKLEHWPRPTINNPESFVSFQRFLDKWFKRSYFTILYPIFNPQLSLRLQKINFHQR